ncbi:helix-turn-helix transcriptional regulator [Streptomyces sp. NPDC093594]|uniref:helix-turn-helix domain-containing protein n=1 Tax=Streptomyces sp. NPDC093594 TaxID=3155305 RepID=UPI0034502262
MPKMTRPWGELTKQVARTVRDLRERRSWTTDDLSRRLTDAGYSLAQSGVARLESGGRRITVDDLEALAAVFGVHPTALLSSGAPEADPCAVHGHSYDSREITGPGPRTCNDCGHIEDLED